MSGGAFLVGLLGRGEDSAQIERYRARSPDVLDYEATIEDPKVFTRPWTMRMPLYRRAEANARLTEYKCVEFVEELMYGNLSKKSPK